MKSILNECVERIQRSKQRYRRYMAILLVLSLCTTLVVNWGLHQNGISMTSDYQCGLEEHEHTGACYTQTLLCSQEEAEDGHQHNGACYETALTCEKQEHVHTIECMIDESADVETASVWEATLPTDLIGVWADDLAAVAESQLGYRESTRNFRLSDDGTTKQGYTRYGAWYGNEYANWSTMFAAFCLHYAGIPTATVPVNSGVNAWIVDLKQAQLWQEAEGYEPKKGDIVFLDTEKDDGTADRAGIITELTADESGTLTGFRGIIGDSNDAVEQQEFVLGDAPIVGYVSLPENPDARTDDADADQSESGEETAPDGDAVTQTAQTEHYSVTVTYGAEAEIPAEAQLQVTEYGEDSEEYQNACEQTGESYDWLLDVGFYVDGQEIEPKAAIEIAVTRLDADETEQEATEKTITHFADSGVESVTGENKANTTTFSVGSLSLLGQIKNIGSVSLDVSLLSDTPVNVFSDISMAAEKPDYGEDTDTVSGVIEQSGVTIEGVEGSITATSDAATSKIEKEFTGTSEQDGKVMTDKSVTYGTDDYSAFTEYADGTFGVTMSALGQEFNVTSTDSYKVPLDVVFVLDVSNSMGEDASDTQTKREAMVNAVNKAITYIQTDNEQNRVGIALFSSNASTLLTLNRYTGVGNGNNKKYIEINNNRLRTVNRLTIQGQSTNLGNNYGGLTQNLGTYTQAGIETGAKLLTNESTTTAQVTTTEGKTLTVQRQPVIILLSDGVPTHGNNNYSNVTGTTASGNGSDSDNKVIEGYYTILTANYYKSQISSHYSKTAKFYTIGEGIAPISNNSSDAVAYANAVLNPSKDTMTYLNGMNEKNGYTRVTRLIGMLGQTIDNGTTYNVGNSGSNGLDANLAPRSTETYYKSGIQQYPDYSYSDGSYFGNMNDEQLQAAFESMIKQSAKLITYGFNLATSTSVTLSDPVGTGMEVKGDPVLRFGNQNYSCTSKSDSTDADGNTITTYVYDYKTTYAAAYPDNYKSDGTGNTGTHHAANAQLDLSKITVTVTTASNGQQTVKMDVPAELMPTYYPDDLQKFYYHETPVRLVYQVGLTQAAIDAVDNLDDGATVTYYTNQWQGGSAAGTFTTTSDNSYNFNEDSKTKERNATETNESYFSGSKSGNDVTQTLGNNGRLTIKKGGTTDLTVTKQWSDGADSHTGDSVTVNLLQLSSDGTSRTYASVTLNSGNNWTYTWKDLPLRNRTAGVTYTYQVQEESVSGYKVKYESTTDENGVIQWTITNVADSDVRLQVEKKWFESDGTTPITDTSQLPSITATLYQKDFKQADNGVNVTINYYYYYGYYSRQEVSDSVQTVTVAAGSEFSFYMNKTNAGTVSVSGNATVERDGSYNGYPVYKVSNVQGSDVTITVSYGQRSYNYYPSFGGYVIQPTAPDTTSADQTNEVGTFTLSNENDWQKFWTAADLNEQTGHTYSYWVTETTVEGYTTTILYKDAENALSPTDVNKTITISNVKEPAFVLPETGSSGTTLFTAGGIALMGLSLLAGSSLRRRRERRVVR